ncbi:hypothetical protein Acid345_2596 [Candidatus Koribacter versatilis Ellin345]|uniref:Uncharacterized protein n=1 Tax=Koribacter versatilis (strain Ellin345) TaxID=204669 RepID=Q1INF3_KORVE|nr:hypothetical protein [Candidatus Koribacter versatilis]ABF41597.1 hypothetical protein Acid345_2596 [Candidatus Koribacter versatilis Ellin345]
MYGTGPAPDTPQFQTKETPGTDICKFCGMPIGGQYYRVGQSMACATCAEKMRIEGPQNPHGAYARALVFGIGASIAGLIIYATFEIMTGWIIGYLSLLVGFMVGRAMMAGSQGWGGTKYQITAALLTYFAVSIAAVPVMISVMGKQSHKPAQVKNVPQTTAPQSVTPAPDRTPDASDSAQPATKPQKPKMGMGSAFGLLLLLGLASPFIELASPLHGLIGLFILYIGIQIAWKTAAGKQQPAITGPY